MTRIVGLMNIQTDFVEAEMINKSRHEQTLTLLRDNVSLDEIPIVLSGLTTHFNLRTRSFNTTLNLGGRLEISQGQLCCIIGQHGHGKSTMMKLLSGTFVR